MQQASESTPALRDAADTFATANNTTLTSELQVLGQMLHLKVFKPIRREVEGRKDIEKRLTDRKKVRVDYDAYRRKQLTLKQQDPSNVRAAHIALTAHPPSPSAARMMLEGSQRRHSIHSLSLVRTLAAPRPSSTGTDVQCQLGEREADVRQAFGSRRT